MDFIILPNVIKSRTFHLLGNLWIESKKDAFCINHYSHNVSSQAECQNICIKDLECVGYSYSKKIGSTEYCLICRDIKLDTASNNFGFYERQGIAELYCQNLFTYHENDKHEVSSKNL